MDSCQLDKSSVSIGEVENRLKFIAVAIAWFVATGVQWDLVQAFGWGRMIAINSQAMPLVDAVKKAFDGEMCPVCKMVNAAKRSENSGAIPNDRVAPKLILFFQQPRAVVFKVPEVSRWLCNDPEPSSVLRAAPPTRPPRAAQIVRT